MMSFSYRAKLSKKLNKCTYRPIWSEFCADPIYTTNAIESLNSVLRSAVNKRKVFPSDESAKKVVYLAVLNASKKWTMPIRDWTSALNRFTIEFSDRVEPYL